MFLDIHLVQGFFRCGGIHRRSPADEKPGCVFDLADAFAGGVRIATFDQRISELCGEGCPVLPIVNRISESRYLTSYTPATLGIKIPLGLRASILMDSQATQSDHARMISWYPNDLRFHRSPPMPATAPLPPASPRMPGSGSRRLPSSRSARRASHAWICDRLPACPVAVQSAPAAVGSGHTG